jgi:membrane protein YqaA with SNARE-associated domain
VGPPPPPADRRAPRPSNQARRRLLHVVASLHRWAESGWSRSAVATWGLLQGSVVPGPADALLAPLALADPRKTFRLAAAAAAGSTLGGLIGFWIGALAFDELGLPLLRLIGIGDEELASSRALVAERGFLLVALGAFTPLPAKAVYMAAGAFGLPFGRFSLALVIARTTRYLIVATLLRVAGERAVRWLERRLRRPIGTLR